MRVTSVLDQMRPPPPERSANQVSKQNEKQHPQKQQIKHFFRSEKNKHQEHN
jgi:hypothetical protein